MTKYFKNSPFLLAIFLDGITLGLIFPILYAIVVDPKTSIFQAAYTHDQRELIYNIVIFLYMFSWAWGSAFISALSDRFGRKPILLIALAGNFVSLILTAFSIAAASLSLLIIGRIVGGLTNAIQPQAEAVAIDVCPQYKLRTVYIAYMLVPIALGDLIGNLMVHYMDYFTWLSADVNLRPIYLLSILTALSFVLILLFFKETFVGDKTLKIKFSYPITMFKNALTDKKIRTLSLIFLISVIGWGLFYNYLSTFAEGYFKLTTAQVDFTLAIPGVSLLFAWGLFTRLWHAKLNPVSVFVSNKVIIIVAVLMIALIMRLNLFWGLVFVVALCSGIAYVTLLGLYANLVSDHRQGWMMGVASAFHFLAFAVASIIASVMVALPTVFLYYLSCVFVLLSILLILRYRKLISKDVCAA